MFALHAPAMYSAKLVFPPQGLYFPSSTFELSTGMIRWYPAFKPPARCCISHRKLLRDAGGSTNILVVENRSRCNPYEPSAYNPLWIPFFLYVLVHALQPACCCLSSSSTNRGILIHLLSLPRVPKQVSLSVPELTTPFQASARSSSATTVEAYAD